MVFEKIEPLKISPEVLGNFVNVCPTCGIHSFFSRLSLEMHKEVCSKILQQEWFSYSKVSHPRKLFHSLDIGNSYPNMRRMIDSDI